MPEAADGLDAAGSLTPEQSLLGVLLDDDPPPFQQALLAWLEEYSRVRSRCPPRPPLGVPDARPDGGPAL
ncbi:hypothetical protein ACFW7J_38190 [Streptomyces sp. NPDC059525]|uniref:hypothetical protein n=1 Tax=Streptomyces sp. NPDC059525 TaxID=3346857 RepID=UPI0036AB503A